MVQDDSPKTANYSTPPRFKVEGARRLPVRTIARKLVQPSGTFTLRWRASMTVAALEVTVSFVVKGDRGWVRLSPDRGTTVRLEAIPQPRGGRRWVFVDHAGVRCTVLFQPPGESRFASRETWGLVYASQSASHRRRAANRAASIRRGLGGSPDLAEPFPARPPRMHRATYERHRARAEAAAAIANIGRPLPSLTRSPTP